MPYVTRRSMLAAGVGAVGVGLVSGPTSAFAASPDRRATGLPVRSQFVPALGSLFTARGGSTRHRLKLVEILDVPPTTVPDDENAYNLLFEQAGGPRLADGIFTLTSVRAPSCTLFLSPVDLPGRHRVQALVNRRSS
jgi:hypothetical protein